MRWLRVHADYDDAHPWDALDLIAGLAGPDPAPARARGIRGPCARATTSTAWPPTWRSSAPPRRPRGRRGRGRPPLAAADSQGVFAGGR